MATISQANETQIPLQPIPHPPALQTSHGNLDSPSIQVLNSATTDGADLQRRDNTDQQITTAPKSWSSIFKPTLISEGKERLEYVEPIFSNGILQIEDHVLEEGIEEWKEKLVGYFIDEKAPTSLVKHFLKNKWKLLGEVEIGIDEDLYYFTFFNKEDRDRVLEEGSFHISSKYFVIFPWSIEIENEKNCIKSVPIWVKFTKIPKQIWNEKGLSKLASSIGKPMFMDKCTKEKKVLSFARVCIEVQANKELPATVHTKVSKTTAAVVNVNYSWKPKICIFCQRFGHETIKCSKNPAILPIQQPPTNDKSSNQFQNNSLNYPPHRNFQQSAHYGRNREINRQNLNWREKERGESSINHGYNDRMSNRYAILNDGVEEGEIVEVARNSDKESDKEDESGKNVENEEGNEIVETIINSERERQSLVVEMQNVTDEGTREIPQLNETIPEVETSSENVGSTKSPETIHRGVNAPTPVRGLRREISPINSVEMKGNSILDENGRVVSQALKETERIRKRWEERQQKEKEESQTEELARQMVEANRSIKQKGRGKQGKTKTMKLSTITDREQQTVEEEIEDGEPLKNFLL